MQGNSVFWRSALMHTALIAAMAIVDVAVADVANATSPPTRQSVFDHYHKLDSPPRQSWPTAIRRVEEAGGWRVYARERRASVDAAPPPPVVNPR